MCNVPKVLMCMFLLKPVPLAPWLLLTDNPPLCNVLVSILQLLLNANTRGADKSEKDLANKLLTEMNENQVHIADITAKLD